MSRNSDDLDQLTETWTQIAHGRLVDKKVSYRQAVRILANRLATLVRPGDARRPYVTAMVQQGYRLATAYKVVNRAFALSAERMAVTVLTAKTGASALPETIQRSAPTGAPSTTQTDPTKGALPAMPHPVRKIADTAPPPTCGPARAPRTPLLADPVYYSRQGQPAFGATPWRYFQDNPKLPLYASAAYPMSDVAVPVLDAHNWVAPYGVDDTGTPLAPYGVTHRYGYPVRREGVPPASPLPSPKTHATGEEGWEDW
ncbi:MAG: hypothetical protein ACYCXT_04005 [Acidiferrobacteraceae bacterium]